MTEALGLAGATETPLVVVEVQRGGPSTGLPTRTEQGDLEFILHASHGEFPRIALAPGTIEESFDAGWRAFNLAERYQCPVLIISDQYLASSLRTVDWEALDFRSVGIDRGQLLTREESDAWEGPYRRYSATPTGISPRAVPSHPKSVYVTTGDEHTEEGFITEDAEIRRRQMEKRMRKLEEAAREIRDPEVHGPEEADITLVGWGSTYGPLRETVDTLNREGGRSNLLHLCDIWPFPAARVAEILGGARLTVAVENNYTGQMANVIRAQTGLSVDERILKYDGRPFSSEYIIAQLKEMMVHV